MAVASWKKSLKIRRRQDETDLDGGVSGVDAVLVDHLEVDHQVGWAVRPTQLPTRHAEGLSGGTDGDCSFPHSGQSCLNHFIVHQQDYQMTVVNEIKHEMTSSKLTNSDVFVRLVDNPLVYFIWNAQDVPLLAQVCDVLQFLPLEHLSQRVVRSVQNNNFRFWIEHAF
jgi:hypothetical protein